MNKLFKELEGYLQEIESAGLEIKTKEELEECINTYFAVERWSAAEAIEMNKNNPNTPKTSIEQLHDLTKTFKRKKWKTNRHIH